MDKYHVAEAKDAFNWPICDFEEYVAGYKLYKQLKGKRDAVEKGEAANAIKQIFG